MVFECHIQRGQKVGPLSHGVGVKMVIRILLCPSHSGTLSHIRKSANDFVVIVGKVLTVVEQFDLANPIPILGMGSIKYIWRFNN